MIPARLGRLWRLGFPILVALALAAGVAAHLTGQPGLGDAVWLAATAFAAALLAIGIGRDLLAGRAGVDLIALLAMGGAIAVDEYLAGVVVALMYATGQALEHYAQGQAERELSALVARAPAFAQRYEDGALVRRPVGEVAAGDRLLIRPGDIIPVDGLILDAPATLDEAALTGESRLVRRDPGQLVLSGAINAGGGFELRATASAEASTYAGIVRLVREAQASKAPLVRLADRYALLFLPLTLVIAGGAWLWSGDPVRAVAVLVVATPCPLLLAAPIAIVAGISRAAQRGVIIKGGGPLEVLAGAKVVLLDKTGTLTSGRSGLTRIEVPAGADPDEPLRLAGSLEQASGHVLAAAIVHATRQRGLGLVAPTQVVEGAGDGIAGRVEAHEVRVGNAEWVAGGELLGSWARKAQRRVTASGASAVYVGVDGELRAVLVLEDPLRPEAPSALRMLRAAGVERLVMVTGDHPSVADTIGAALGLDAILAERTPAEKVDAVRTARALAPGATIMVGDGINDAPALAAADCGVAMGARGATASSEAADVVITVDRLDRLAEALRIAQRSRGIALQSVSFGMAASIVAMLVAAAGYLPPISGAVLQEGIDIAVILNALRALGGDGLRVPRLEGWRETRSRLEAEHAELGGLSTDIRAVAEGLDTLPGPKLMVRLRDLVSGLTTELLPHEQHEESTIYPLLAGALGGPDPLAALSATHREIFHRVRLLERLVAGLPESGPEAEELPELRHLLFGLQAILDLHMAQETELYASIQDPREARPASAARGSERRPA